MNDDELPGNVVQNKDGTYSVLYRGMRIGRYDHCPGASQLDRRLNGHGRTNQHSRSDDE